LKISSQALFIKQANKKGKDKKELKKKDKKH
jgi:hypothetical protein